jgi:hypothetical protein
MMSQFTLAATVVGVADADGLAEAPADPELLGDALAEAPRADWSIFVGLLPDTAMTSPIASPTAAGIASGTAIRPMRLRRIRRRHAGRCPVRIRPTSVSAMGSR